MLISFSHIQPHAVWSVDEETLSTLRLPAVGRLEPGRPASLWTPRWSPFCAPFAVSRLSLSRFFPLVGPKQRDWSHVGWRRLHVVGRRWNDRRDVLAPVLPRGLGPLVFCLSKRRLVDWNLGDCECPSVFWGTFSTRFFSAADFQNTGGKLMMTSLLREE